MKYILTTLCCLLFVTQVIAVENQPGITVSYLLENGYNKMTTLEVQQQLLGKTLIVLDLQAGSQYEAKFLQHGVRELKKIKEAHPSSLTDAEYQGRAEALTGNARFSLKDDRVISTDGIRTYSVLLYQKENIIYGVRDVDLGRINFQITIKK